MSYTVMKYSGHLRTVSRNLEKTHLRLSTFSSCSQMPVVFYHSNTRLWLNIYLLNIFAIYLMLSLRLEAILVCLAVVLLGIEVIFTIATMITFKR